MPSKRPPHKKSVSFSDSHKTPSQEDGLYTVLFSVKALPVHLLMILYSIFSGEIEPKNVTEVLTFHLYLLLAAQLFYAVIFNSSICETRKGKSKMVRFNVSSEYSLLFLALIVCALSVPALYLLLVVFGAPFTTLIHENLLLAAHLSLLCFPVVVSCLKLAQLNPSFYKYFASVAIGAWFGAIAIPLDWDRPWQSWPLPIVGGAYVGAAIGYALGWVI